MGLIGGGKKTVPLVALINEFFSPTSDTNKNSSVLAANLAVVAVASLLTKLCDKKKNTSSYLSSLDAGLQKMAVNDLVECLFGGLTLELQAYGCIGLANAGGLSQIWINGDLSHGYEKGSCNSKTDNSMSVKRKGIFHLLSDEMRESLLMVAMKDAPTARKSDQAALLMQQEARQCKEELAKEHALELAMEEYIDALYYFDMYGSEAYWKTTAIVDTKLNKLTSKIAKLRALQENIQI
eukprot:2848862-Ditylum_brightwellii.AAC.1